MAATADRVQWSDLARSPRLEEADQSLPSKLSPAGQHRCHHSGLKVTPGRIVLAGTIAVEHVAALASRARIAIYGSSAVGAYAASRGLRLGHDEPRFVLLARDLRFSYARMHRIVRQIERGPKLVVSNLDISHPGPDGQRIFERGVLFAAIKACLPDVDYTVVGKPSPLLYQAATRRVAAAKDQLRAIGDNPATDEEGAPG
jgi:ribonucleotide monophosphatase NagD (HAD superfamily)